MFKLLVGTILVPLGLTAAVSGTDAAIQKNWIGSNNINIFKWRHEWYHENRKKKSIILKLHILIESFTILLNNVVRVVKTKKMEK